METLELLKLDMANYTIQQMRPYIQQQAVAYEQKKFKELLELQKGLFPKPFLFVILIFIKSKNKKLTNKR